MHEEKHINQSFPKLAKDLASLFAKYPSILSAYLFGSMAQGIAKPVSDVDIAIRIGKDVSFDTHFDIRIRVLADLEAYFSRKVDVVVMNSASLKMIHQILLNGKLIFTRVREKEFDYYIQKQKEYFDFKYYIDKDIREMKEYFET